MIVSNESNIVAKIIYKLRYKQEEEEKRPSEGGWTKSDEDFASSAITKEFYCLVILLSSLLVNIYKILFIAVTSD